ncbi:MAG: twin-arginine translocase TatA/TatE family subunit [Hyphomicrobiaceae bacterium TMED74]|jgi:sec-independent protein translocase protein TatA|nr:twin-arginine translocase TatA/TatE family subunit [Filomicrobium sp.]RPG39645.1 MAG: twin-arginine translocase TatA/TatE family subunit [Hyphomicrobiaceae bacterium TMED74]
MGTFSIWHWLIVLAIVILLFGRGRIPELMGDVAKGIKNFKKGMSDDTKTDTAENKAIEESAEKPVENTTSETTKAS